MRNSYILFLLLLLTSCNGSSSGTLVPSGPESSPAKGDDPGNPDIPFNGAGNQVQSGIGYDPFSTTNPADLFIAQMDKYVDPLLGYETSSNELREPVPFDTGSTVTAFPSNKWFIDLAYLSRYRTINQGGSKVFASENFTVMSFPFGVGIRDGAGADTIGQALPADMWPGLVVYGAKTPYMSVLSPNPPPPNPDPKNPLLYDMFENLLQQDNTEDLAFRVPRDTQLSNISRTITEADELIFNTKWTDKGSGGSLEALVARGSPYLTFRYNNLKIQMEPGQAIYAMSVDQKPLMKADGTLMGQIVTGKRFKLFLYGAQQATGSQYSAYQNGYTEYLIYASQPVSLTVQNPTTLLSNSPFTGVLRAAFVAGGIPDSVVGVISDPDFPAKLVAYDQQNLSGKESILDTYSNIYPTESTVQLTSDGKTANVQFNWVTANMDSTNNNQNLLMMAFKQTHLKNIANPIVLGTLTYPSLRGDMVGVTGQTWVQNVPLVSADWTAPRPIQEEYQKLILTQLPADVASTQALLADPTSKNDSYTYGKILARIARLILIADEVGDQQSRTQLTSTLEQLIGPWLSSGQPDDPDGLNQGFFKYDLNFGGVMTARSMSDDNRVNRGFGDDYFNIYFNDHHYHYGYYIYAASVLGKYDPTWLAQYREKVTGLLRDLTNGSIADLYFPKYRYFDWFEGHSMASGLEPNGRGRNQESTSEAVNAWYAMALWGMVTQNTQIQELGQLLATLEIQGAQAWWQITPGVSFHDPYQVLPNTHFNPTNQTYRMNQDGMAGIMYETAMDNTTFFGLRRGFILGMQILPFTPITESLIPNAWITANSDSSNPAASMNVALNNFMQTLEIYREGPTNAKAQYDAAVDDPTADPPPGIPLDACKWSALLYLVQGSLDPDTAYQRLFATGSKGGSLTLPDYINAINAAFQTPNYIPADWLDGGLTRTNMLWWLGTRPQ